ncbi:nitroreductase family protein [Capnocytophaga catalasegens]|uniref:Nitroreductase n=1 Tax=Capnocytophaga catalasegens TaxID=1004260 RepID=A0AAV5B173_9FLAO|nr:nitroreductase family protein [Capnocytophaga catalasegens]GIZ16529.1 nitroreductase [Capnocytophaga catalasegens]GJM51457.1 nitroreductase [Capnocytophaga catalasegens]GJM53195.1 nitroreductase [Capnocytophaga catalasegens]
MNLKEILEFRRAVRDFDTAKSIDPEVVKNCLKEAQLTPTSSNMQLWEAYHITDPKMLKRLAKACVSQSAAITAQQMVIFVTRQDLYKKRAKTILEVAKQGIQYIPDTKQREQILKINQWYYGQYLPFVYRRCFGLFGLFRKIIFSIVSFFRPMAKQVSESDMRVVVHKSCGLVAQTFMIAMAEKGYDTCPMEGFDNGQIKKILNLPSGSDINMVVACGIRSEKGVWGNRFRVPFEEQYHRI